MTVAQLVGRERFRLSLALVARGVGLALAIATLLVALSVVALGGARWITRPSAPMLAWGFVLLITGAVLWWTRRLVRHTASPLAVAREIEEERALRAGSLRGALEVAESGALGRRAADEMASRLAAAGRVLAPSLHRHAWRRGAVAVLASILALIALGAARRKAPDGWRALRHPIGAWTGSILPPLEIVDPPRLLTRGERLRVQVRAPDRRTISLRTRSTGTTWNARALTVQDGVAATVLGPLDADVRLVASDGRTSSDTVLVRVTDRPFVGDVAIRALYPAYLKRPPETIAVGEPARVPRGTVLSIAGRASTELTGVGLVRDADTLRLAADGHAFRGRMVAVVSGRWLWFATSGQGPVADLPAPLELEVVPDSAPRVEILVPQRDTVVLPDAQLSLRASAVDDHGISSVTLRSWRQLASGRAMPALAQVLASPAAPQWSGDQTIDLGSRGLEPGDELHLVVAATDDSPWRQTATSRELVLRVPSLSEQRGMARALADSASARASAAAKSERDLAQRTSEAARSRADRASSDGSNQSGQQSGRERAAQKGSMSYQSAEQARALAREQQQLQEQVRAVQRDAQELERQLRAAGALDSALAQRLREAQQLLREALTPQLQQQLDEVLKATQQLSPEDVRKALENLSEQQQRLREQLERSAEMLKRAAMEGAMQTLRDEAREIAQRERAVADSLARSDSSGRTEASSLSQRSRELSENIAKLSKRLQQEKAEGGPKRLQSAAERAQQSADAMQRASQGSRRQGGGERAEQAAAAREGAQQMEQAAQQLSDARDAQIQEWKNELTGELDRSIQETLQLAREQESIAQRARSGERQDLRADQSAVQQGTEQVGERIQKAAQRSAHVSAQSQGALGEAQRRVQEATQQLAESQGNGQQPATSMDEAAQALNKAAAQLMRDRERAARGSSASGFAELLEQMRQLAREQGSLNAQSAGIMPVPGARPSPQMMAQARTLARQQRAIAQRLDDAGAGEARAAELAKEMRQIADALESGRLDPGLLDRQQRLFHRLLDAGLTMEKDEREDTGQRESKPGTGAAVLTPGTRAGGRAAVRYHEPTWSEMRGLSAEERRAVLEYFKRINAERP